MNRIVLLLLTLSGIMSCRADQQSSNENAKGANENIQNQSVITGNWVNEKYYKSIASDQSPRQAQKTCEFCFLNIPSNTNKPAKAIYNFHEALDYFIVKKTDGTFDLWSEENNQPKNKIDAINIKSGEQIKIGVNTFLRIHCEEEDGRFKILEQLLFKGSYLNEEEATVTFKNNGEVNGLGEYKYYAPLTDYNDAGLNIDQLQLGKTKDDLNAFGFKFKKKKLEIFVLDCKTKDDQGNCVEVAFGQKLFNLKKSK